MNSLRQDGSEALSRDVKKVQIYLDKQAQTHTHTPTPMQMYMQTKRTHTTTHTDIRTHARIKKEAPKGKTLRLVNINQ